MTACASSARDSGGDAGVSARVPGELFETLQPRARIPVGLGAPVPVGSNQDWIVPAKRSEGNPYMTGSRVVALGHYQPAKVLTNDDLAAMVDTSDEWITSRVGIKTRHVGGPDEPVDELAAHAAAKALASAGLQPADIDLVLVATSTAIDRSPSMSARVAARLGMGSPTVMDINVVCSGFTHALATADHAVRAGAATRALVIGADKMGDIVDWTDRSTCVLMGDGAGAAVVTADPEGATTQGSARSCGVRCRRWATPYGSRARPRGSRRRGSPSTAGPPRSCRRSPARYANGQASRPRNWPRWYCIRPT